MDIDIFSENCLEMGITLPTGLTFFYDETNNIHKLSIRKNELGYSLNNTKMEFVLGGVAIPDGHLVDPGPMFKKCGLLTGSHTEVKSKSFFNPKHPFLYNMGSKRMTIFLNWLKDEKIFIHYTCTNAFYYGLVDIVDSLIFNNLEQGEVMSFFHLKMKDSLYHMVLDREEDVLKLMNAYNYPHVTDMSNFSKNLSELLWDYLSNKNDDPDMFFLECMRQMLKYVANVEEDMPFIKNQEAGVLADCFYVDYIERMGVAPECFHIFDREDKVIYECNKKLVQYNGNPYKNYKFVDSKDEPLIQVSDVVVKMIAEYVEFIENVDYDLSSQNIEKQQLDNLRILKELIDRTESKSQCMINSFDPVSSSRRRWAALDALFECEQLE